MSGLQHLRLLSLHGTFSWDGGDEEMVQVGGRRGEGGVTPRWSSQARARARAPISTQLTCLAAPFPACCSDRGLPFRTPLQPVNLSALTPLKELRVLSISECFRLVALPPAVVGLTRLKALHLEKCPSLEGLPDNLLLPRLLMLRWAGQSCRGSVGVFTCPFIDIAPSSPLPPTCPDLCCSFPSSFTASTGPFCLPAMLLLRASRSCSRCVGVSVLWQPSWQQRAASWQQW